MPFCRTSLTLSPRAVLWSHRAKLEVLVTAVGDMTKSCPSEGEFYPTLPAWSSSQCPSQELRHNEPGEKDLEAT